MTKPPLTNHTTGPTRTDEQTHDVAKNATGKTARDTVEELMLTLATQSLVADDRIADAIRAHFAAGGKRIRAQMALTTGQCLGLDTQTSQAIAACCELLHNASLVHDDIQDADATRREHAAMWAQHGQDIAICAGDELISAAYAALAGVKDARAISALITLTHRAVSRTVAGQTADLAQTGQALDDITLYETIASEKSGPLLGLPVTLGLSVAGALDDIETVERTVRLIAIAYQFVDDIGDWQEDQVQESLNGVLVLARANHSQPIDAIAEAATLTRAHLRHARELAARLPQGCGAVFVGLADRLEAKLTQELALAS